jgi:hypothetical protein
MPETTFPREDLVELTYYEPGRGFGDYRVIEKSITDTGRWSIRYSQVFEYDGNFYLTRFSVGATECQDEVPYEDQGDEITVTQVYPVKKTVIAYVPEVK